MSSYEGNKVVSNKGLVCSRDPVGASSALLIRLVCTGFRPRPASGRILGTHRVAGRTRELLSGSDWQLR